MVSILEPPDTAILFFETYVTFQGTMVTVCLPRNPVMPYRPR